MKKIIGLGILSALLLALPLADTAVAKKEDKVAVCHITHIEYNDDGSIEFPMMGHVIVVPQVACAAHCAHGDHKPVDWNDRPGNMCGRWTDPPHTGCPE